MDWALHPPELLSLIAERLAFNDHTCFSCVCNSWRAIAKSNTGSEQPIWLMLPSSNSSNYLDLYNFYTNNINKFYVPGVIGKTCFGLNLGYWILAFYENDAFSLHHLFTRAAIRIPEVPSSMHARNYIPTRALVSSDPSATVDWILIISLQLGQDFKYILFNNGRNNWTDIDRLGRRKIFKSAVHNNRLYGASCSHDIFMSHLDSPSYRILDYGTWMHSTNPGNRGLYLVESMGDLLLATRDESESRESECFSVFRMEGTRGEEMKWSRIGSVGDRVIFVSDNHCLSLDARECGGRFRGNCVYFCDPSVASKESGEGCLGVYSLDDCSVDLLPCCFGSVEGWKRASWFRSSSG